MATVDLPEQPNLDHLRNQARDLQRGVRSADPRSLRRAGLTEATGDYPLTRAQLVVARRYGFASWPRLKHHVEAINALTWTYAEPPPDEPTSDRFLRLACLHYGNDNAADWSAAAALLAGEPQLVTSGVSVAAVGTDIGAVRRHLAADPDSANRRSGPHGWSPLMYLGYSRLERPREATLTAAQLLIDAGADVNDGRFFLGLPTPFTILTGVFGGGEQHPPAHRHAIPLARLLLSNGAEPNDGQALYNRMFTPDDDFLEVLFEFGLGTGDGGPWRTLLPDLLAPPEELLRDLLGWAVTHDQRGRVELLARHGVDIDTPISTGRRPIDLAVVNGLPVMAQLLRTLGAGEASSDAVEAFVGSALAGDDIAARSTPVEVIEAARIRRPGLVVWAAAQGRPAAVSLLVDLGFDVNAFGRGDVPVDDPWQTALHCAVEQGSAPLVRLLLELGADTTLRDKRFDGTPLDWADHFGRSELRPLLLG